MPLEIIIDTKRKKGLRIYLLPTLQKVDQLSQYITAQPDMARPLSLAEGLKFVRQSYYGGDSASYAVPNQFDMPFLSSYLEGPSNTTPSNTTSPNTASPNGISPNGTASNTTQSNTSPPNGTPAPTIKKNALTQLLKSFVDSNQQELRISVNMADVGSRRLPLILDSLQKKSASLFDSAKYKVTFTGSSVTFLEGSSFIIKGLKDSIQWAFLLIAACMLLLFRSLRILICSLVPNIIPLIVTAGIMGWAGVRLKPSTVIIFSIALGVAIDITIRFLVNYKQELERQHKAQTDSANSTTGTIPPIDPQRTVIDTINKTGISILYTSLVLIAGFVIFCFSDFGGILALGWLTSITLVIATVTNLVFLPALLLTLTKAKKKTGKTSI
jgi:hypothetical protein